MEKVDFKESVEISTEGVLVIQ